MKKYDYILIGSGINSLVCAGLLSKKGYSVAVYERNERAGGCIRTEEITLPGFKHEVFSAVHPMVVSSPAYAELSEDLHKHGLEYCNNNTPTGIVTDKRSLIFSCNRQQNIQQMNQFFQGDGDQYQATMEKLEKNAELIFGLLGNSLWSLSTLKLCIKFAIKAKPQGILDFVYDAIINTRDWLNLTFNSEVNKLLFAPWVLHAGLGPDSTFSALMNQVMLYSIEKTGNPVVKGGNEQIVQCYKAIIKENGGDVICNTPIDEILIEKGKAVGVKTSYGLKIHCKKAVIANTTPTQLYQSLIPKEWVPESIQKQAREYRYGRGMMMIHVAMDSPPEWEDPNLKDVVMLHVAPSINTISTAVNQADNGLLPEKATIVVCQPTAVDPSRAPDGKWILWIQLQEIPQKVLGDSINRIEVPNDGSWTEEVREAYADRIIDQLSASMPNIKKDTLARKVYSPKDLEKLNINLEKGDPYSGVCSIDQFFFWRPLKGLKNHSTPVKNLYHIGASTHPGPSLGGGSGYLVAKSIG